MAKRSDSSVFWKKVRFKYKLSFLNENTLEEVFSFRLSLLSGFWAVSAFAIMLITLTSIVIINTPIRNYLPGYMDIEIRNTMIQNALRTDSLERIIAIQTQYIDNIGGILRGNSPIAQITQPDTLSKAISIEDLQKSKQMETFIRNYEENHPKKK
ncbi:hypothetical protein FACS189413_03690 [Bacteroidia bacterium]|nr:hypothetical protein FACS189463_3220 [Bacteroidia bacterium]GHU67938.1 hypothetical protein FACS189413_03690 [Bacteroidia bacterium]